MHALADLDMTERAAQFPDELSGGERQRVAIARAVVGERGLVLADEPTGALDSVNSEAVMRLLREMCSRGAAGIVVTHESQLASWANRVVFIRDGQVVDQTGASDGPESLLVPGPHAP
jgi:putative ABC transport system ATP-binding protein